MAALRITLLVLLAASTAFAVQVLVIDTFEQDSGVDQDLTYELVREDLPFTDGSVLGTANILGNERDLSIEVTRGPTFTQYSTRVEGGNWFVQTGSAPQEARSFYQLDGVDGDAFNIDVNNLNIDMTVGGGARALLINEKTDLDCIYRFEMYAAGNINEFAFIDVDFPRSINGFFTEHVLEFGLWTTTAGFSFTNVGAFTITANIDSLSDIDSQVGILAIIANEVSGTVVFDCNDNNVADFGELPYPNVRMDLFLQSDLVNEIDFTFSNVDGDFAFLVPPGDYSVCISDQLPNSGRPTIPFGGCRDFSVQNNSEDIELLPYGCYTPVSFVTFPADHAIDCDGCTDTTNNVGCAGSPTVDVCPTGTATVTPNDIDDAVCNGDISIRRTWTVSDGISSEVSTQLITAQDNTNPTFLSFPGDAQPGCTDNTTPAALGSATATDDCSVPFVTFTDNVGSSGCSTPIDRVWTATDSCQNQISGIQEITISDTTPPTVTLTGPAVVNLDCDEGSDPGDARVGTATATDNCSVPDITVDDSDFTPACTVNFVRTYRATDGCGNSAFVTQDITVTDDSPPTLFVPADTTAECGGSVDPDVTGTATAVDNCDSEPQITFTTVAGDGGCADGFVRTWTASDGCNAVSGDQTISVNDTEDPTFVFFPDPATVDCSLVLNGATVPPASANGTPTATDSCTGVTTPTFTDISVTGNSCLTTITRRWTVADGCGNAIFSTQFITATDTTPPSVVAPTNADVECGSSTTVASLGTATATDDCSTVSVSASTEVVGTDDCRTTFARTFTATACDATSIAVQTITVTDTQQPIINIPTDRTVQCTSEAGSMDITPGQLGTATATDVCTGTVISFSDVATGALCPDGIEIDRTWTATDVCGNVASGVQEIDIVNTQSPSITAPATFSTDCSNAFGPNEAGFATASGVCDPDLTPTFTDSVSTSSCPTVVTRTWTVTTPCNNSASTIQTITLTDNIRPTFPNFVDTIDVDCEDGTDPNSTYLPTIVDNCDPSPDLTFTDVTSSGPALAGICEPDIVIRRTWVATDSCGNTNSMTTTITVDQEAPVACTPVPCNPVPCDTEDCPSDDCCCGGDAVDCTPADCVATPCNAVACTAVECTNCGGGSGGSNGCNPVMCEPVTIYYDDEDEIPAGGFQ